MAKAAVLFIASILIALSVAQLSSKGGNCPLKNSVSKCTPTCTSDFQCSFGQKCCPNKCGSKSCAQPSAVNTGSSEGGYKGSTDRTVLCGGVRCGRYEKCELDRATKRQKCVRI